MAAVLLPPAVQMSDSKYGDGAVAMPGGIATDSHPVMLEVAPPLQPAAEEEKNDLQQKQAKNQHTPDRAAKMQWSRRRRNSNCYYDFLKWKKKTSKRNKRNQISMPI